MDFSIRQLTAEDLPLCLALSRSNGWNQTRNDWSRLIELQPYGCWAAHYEQQLIGTVTTITYPPGLAWVGMMLVDTKFRRRGIATQLLTHAIEWLRAEGVGTIKLDATPLGMPVYEKLGFIEEWRYQRWQRTESGSAKSTMRRDVGRRSWGQIVDWDQRAFGANRGKLLEHLAKDCELWFDDSGFGMLREGKIGAYIGPVVCESDEVAKRCIDSLLTRVGGAILWDVPTPNRAAMQMASELGFSPVRELTRMRIGQELIEPDVDIQYAIAGPSVG